MLGFPHASIVTGLAVAALAGGCFTTTIGRRFDPETIQRFEVGRTTRAEVLAELGNPFTRSLDFSGNETWVYWYSSSRAVVNPVSLVVPFYSDVHADSYTVSASLLFRGDTLATVYWLGPGGLLTATPAPSSSAGEGESE